MDHVILGFDPASAMTCLVWPVILGNEEELRFGMPGYRDTLCSFIGKEMRSVDLDRELNVSIDFGNGPEIIVPLGTGGAKGEHAILTHQGKLVLVV
jgi:hypothetical protein